MTSRGYITLISVLIVSAVATTIIASVIMLGISSSRTSFTLEQSNQAKGLANACAEEALERIVESTPYTGSDGLSLGQGSCIFTVTSQGGQNRTVTASGLVGEVTRKVKIVIIKVNPNIEISSWQEVADF